jgi:hypothetical protein
MTLVKMLLCGAITTATMLLLVSSSVDAQKPKSKAFDTNGDGTKDVTIRGTGTKIHIDTDNDGVEDPGEVVIFGRSVKWGGGGGPRGIKIKITVDTGTESVKSTYLIRDNNGDGDTDDPGEVTQPPPKK